MPFNTASIAARDAAIEARFIMKNSARGREV
jgi:hypothetical protein